MYKYVSEKILSDYILKFQFFPPEIFQFNLKSNYSEEIIIIKYIIKIIGIPILEILDLI